MSISHDAWTAWRTFTQARIALGRAGGSLPTQKWLEFNLAHGLARDSVYTELDVESLQTELTRRGQSSIVVSSAARDRSEFLRRPDLGRQLQAGEADRLKTFLQSTRSANEPNDLVVIIGDGLSSPAAQVHAVPLLDKLLPALQAAGWTIAPIVIALQSRVALQDEIGAIAGARLSLMVLGERPGLSSPDSLGAYFILNPRPGSHDAQRNCVSNIRPAGLPIQPASDTLYYLLSQSRHRHLSGVHLKDERILELPSPTSLETHIAISNATSNP